MPHTNGLLSGTPCWVGLDSTDPPASRDFYAALLGWRYTVDQRGGALAHVAPDTVAAGIDPGRRHEWRLHLAIRNPWIAAERVRQHGGRVVRGPLEGRTVIAEDPSGGLIALSAPRPDVTLAYGIPGCFEWADLNTRDGQLADKFFRGLFGYSQGQVGDGVDLDYTVWWLNGRAVLGRYQMGQEFPANTPPHWTVFFQVTDTDEAARCARRQAGTVVVEPFDSEYGRVAVLTDPQGATFSVIEPAEEVEEPVDPYDD
jgi:predicted enzyme related to lactoylglutathione lyase